MPSNTLSDYHKALARLSHSVDDFVVYDSVSDSAKAFPFPLKPSGKPIAPSGLAHYIEEHELPHPRCLCRSPLKIFKASAGASKAVRNKWLATCHLGFVTRGGEGCKWFCNLDKIRSANMYDTLNYLAITSHRFRGPNGVFHMRTVNDFIDEDALPREAPRAGASNAVPAAPAAPAAPAGPAAPVGPAAPAANTPSASQASASSTNTVYIIDLSYLPDD